MDLIGKDLDALWSEERFRDFCKYDYLLPEEVKTESLVFIGMNPSFTEEDLSFKTYKLTQENNIHPYFRKFEDLSKACEIPWTHLDLLFFRETNQSSIDQIIKQEHGLAFIWEQLQLSDRLIRAANPKVMVVANSKAGTFLGKNADYEKKVNIWLGYEFGKKIKRELGTYLWDGEIPVFFSSMLSGQRALDLGSYERLKWHIGFVKERLKL